MVRRRLRDLGRKIKQDLQPIFTSKEVMDELRITELKPLLVNLVKQQNVVYEFKCVLCYTNYIGTRAVFSISVLISINIP